MKTTTIHQLATTLSRSEAAYEFLVRHDIQCGFMDGCCLPFAEAMRLILEQGEIQAVVTLCPDKCVIEHAVLKIDHPDESEPLYIDADGVQTQAEMLYKMAEMELRPDCAIFPLDQLAQEQGINIQSVTWAQQSGVLKFEKLTHHVVGFSEIKMPEALAAIGATLLSEPYRASSLTL